MRKGRTKLKTEALEASIEAKKKAGMSDIPAEKPKNKGGRPKSTEAKDHRLYVYLSDEDYKALKELANKTGEPMSLTARKAIMYRLQHLYKAL